jgi:hypothetical protein
MSSPANVEKTRTVPVTASALMPPDDPERLESFEKTGAIPLMA